MVYLFQAYVFSPIYNLLNVLWWDVGVDSATASSSSNGIGIYSGFPYGLMGGIVYWYIWYVPRLHPKFLSILGMTLSEKSLQYAWMAYVIYGGIGGGHQQALASAMAGFVSTAIYFNTPVLQSSQYFDLPNIIVDGFGSRNNNAAAAGGGGGRRRGGVDPVPFWESIGGVFFLDPPAKIYAPMLIIPPSLNGQNGTAGRARNIAAAAAAAVGAAGGGGGAGGGRPRPTAPVAPPPPPPPPQSAIDQLTAMGFDEGRVRQALQQTDNNVEHAADRLLTSM